MNKYLKNIIGAFSIAALSVPMLTSCESVFDGEGDCDPKYYLQFVYDYNMLYNSNHQIGADAFNAQVGSVEVHLFNSDTGEYVGKFTEEGAPLRQAGYRMPLDVPPGNYDIIAWCGLADNDDHFTLTQPVISASEDLKCRMFRDYDSDGKAFNDKQLNPLFHGTLSVSLPDEEGEYVHTVYLMKDTNYIELALQHKAGPLDPERFTISMSDNNGHLAHDNSLLDDEDVEFRPWSVVGGVVDLGTSTRYGEDVDNGTGFLVAELATSRLMKDHKPVLKITDNETGDVVFSIPMVDWALLFKSARHSAMEDQEYLDREYEYNVMVILDNKDNEGWYAFQIVINGWHVVDNGMVGL